MADGGWNEERRDCRGKASWRMAEFMAKYQRFEELPAWQEAAQLYNRVLDLVEEPGLPLTAVNFHRFPKLNRPFDGHVHWDYLYVLSRIPVYPFAR